ncbi:uncharacterized protein G2W53_009682 [Senna tora]|uniref:Uncharacterized protein n=1 Tax=Senna tora TaxID=362788 RepID=A0A834WZI0_9FABA|nr:uncharacterized protein G2W53_009682 [Senna tora]
MGRIRALAVTGGESNGGKQHSGSTMVWDFGFGWEKVKLEVNGGIFCGVLVRWLRGGVWWLLRWLWRQKTVGYGLEVGWLWRFGKNGEEGDLRKKKKGVLKVGKVRVGARKGFLKKGHSPQRVHAFAAAIQERDILSLWWVKILFEILRNALETVIRLVRRAAPNFPSYYFLHLIKFMDSMRFAGQIARARRQDDSHEFAVLIIGNE